MDQLLRHLVKIHASVAEVLLHLDSVHLPDSDAEVCQQFLERSDITHILLKIKDILSECERKDPLYTEQNAKSPNTSGKEVAVPGYMPLPPDSTVPVTTDNETQEVVADIKEEGVDIKGSSAMENEVHFTVKIPSKRGREASPPRRITRRSVRKDTDDDFTNSDQIQGDTLPERKESPPICVKNETAELVTAIGEEIQTLKKETTNEGSDKQTKEDSTTRWKQKIEEGIRKEDIGCAICGKSGFKSFCYFERHEQSHQDKKPFICHLCNRTFKYKRCVDQHMAVVHSEGTNYECPQCKQTFKQECNLKTHLLTHEEKQHKCDKCDRSFTLGTQLRSHIKTNHEGIFPHWCDVCNKGFKKKAQYEPHMRKHRGEKPFICDVCHKSFTCKLALNKHQQLHAEEIKYTCPVRSPNL